MVHPPENGVRYQGLVNGSSGTSEGGSVRVAHTLLLDDRHVERRSSSASALGPITVAVPGRGPESAPHAGSGRPPASRCGEGCEFTIDPKVRCLSSRSLAHDCRAQGSGGGKFIINPSEMRMNMSSRFLLQSIALVVWLCGVRRRDNEPADERQSARLRNQYAIG